MALVVFGSWVAKFHQACNRIHGNLQILMTKARSSDSKCWGSPDVLGKNGKSRCCFCKKTEVASKDLSKPLCVCLNDGILQRIHWFDTKNYIKIKRNSSKNYQLNDLFQVFFPHQHGKNCYKWGPFVAWLMGLQGQYLHSWRDCQRPGSNGLKGCCLGSKAWNRYVWQLWK